jgi:pyruvate/2-oxoglutarate dehydrogenase complex dihydrolipoamide acyltransferase (E2) component
VTQSAEHLSDEVLSTLIDERLAPEELSEARSHVDACATCRARRDELLSVVVLLRALPAVEPPRSFVLGPQLVVDPPNVIRLRRWYTIARASAASLAAAFVFLAVGTLYVDSQPTDSARTLAAKSQSESAPAPAQNMAAPTQASAPAPVQRAAAPAPAAAPAAAPRPAGAQAPPAGTSGEAGDQIAAATSVHQLPTQVPTTIPPQALPGSSAAQPYMAPQGADAAAPLRTAAAGVGLLAVVGLLAALIVRHRLIATSHPPTE